MCKDSRDDEPALHALYLSTNITVETDDLFNPFAVLSTNPPSFWATAIKCCQGSKIY